MRKRSTQRDASSVTLLAIAVSIALAAGLPMAARAQEKAHILREEGGVARAPTPDGAGPRTDSVATDLDTMVVTGTRIRGGTTPSPLITIDRERIREEGLADLGEVIRSIPQNFNGGQNPGVGVGATLGVGGIANQNVTGGSSLNLRGLGPDATLTLLNGRRMAYGGMVNAVDISSIPVEAVDRIEIVPDGASAIYGSDAVGGVGNVVLRRDYQGVALGARFGGASDGGLVTKDYTFSAGRTWDNGGVIGAYKDLTVDPIFARQRDYTDHMFHPNTLYPGSVFRSALVSVHHSFADSMELLLDAVDAKRHQKSYQWNRADLPYYSMLGSETRTSFLAPVLEFHLPGEWTLSLGGSLGKDEHLQDQFRVDNTTRARAPTLRECYCNQASSYEVGLEGPLFALPGGLARLAAGVGGRSNELERKDLLGNNQGQAFGGIQRSRFVYAELSLPLLGQDSGGRRLELTKALRLEDDQDFGRVSTPKLGLIYGPSENLTLRYSWGRSFKAPTLFQLYQTPSAAVLPATFYGGQDYPPSATVLLRAGGNSELEPERASTQAISLALHPASVPGLEAELTWFDIEYSERVVQPITDYARALLIPGYAEFIDYNPGTEQVAELLGSVDAFYDYVGGFDPAHVVAIMRAQYVNAARQRIKGLDLSASYRFEMRAGRMTMRGSASWLDSTQQNSPSQSVYDVAGVIFNPAQARIRLGTVWDRSVWSASLFSNYTSGVQDPIAGGKTASFTTLDATVRYTTGHGRGGVSGLALALSAQNLLDRRPPTYAAATPDRPPYDSTNYSAIGRFLSLAVTKEW